MGSVPEEQRTLGPWRLLGKLGKGGNATVWEAVSDAFPTPVALKVIDGAKVGSEPYRRFIREIEFLQSLEDQTGILPLLAAHLPEKPSTGDKPWLTMPIATPLREALVDASLERIVAALAVIAKTLARLTDAGVAHRDIKPDNLYELDGEWLVGDFGLVALPEASDVTAPDRPMGPNFYRPYEMIVNPRDADPHAADVYTFGKTLWVLATGQNYPPSGHQPAATRKFSIADLRPHAHAGLLDQLVDRTTRLDPTARPAMAEIADEIDRWLALPTTTTMFDLSAEGARLRKELEAELDAGDLLEQRKELAEAAVRQLNELFKPINDALRTVHPRAQIEQMPDEYVRNILSTRRMSSSPEIVSKHIRMSQIVRGPDFHQYTLRVGRSIELTRDGELIVRAAIDVSYPHLGGTDYSWQSGGFHAPVGSIESAAQLQEIVEQAQEHLREAVTAFTDRIAGDG